MPTIVFVSAVTLALVSAELEVLDVDSLAEFSVGESSELLVEALALSLVDALVPEPLPEDLTLFIEIIFLLCDV